MLDRFPRPYMFVQITSWAHAAPARGNSKMKTLRLSTLLALAFLGLPLLRAQTCPTPVQQKGSKPTEVPLCVVAQQVIKTLNTFNATADSKSLPKLSQVTFDFHTSTSKTEGLSFQILVFSLGANHENDSSNDVSFTYTVPHASASAAQPRTSLQPQDFSQVLLTTLQSAATQVRETQSIGDAKFSNLVVMLGYGVVWDVSGGGNGTISLVTLNGSMDRKRADVQTLTLTFGS